MPVDIHTAVDGVGTFQRVRIPPGGTVSDGRLIRSHASLNTSPGFATRLASQKSNYDIAIARAPDQEAICQMDLEASTRIGTAL